MKKYIFLGLLFFVSILYSTIGCTKKKMESVDSIKTDSTENADTTVSTDSATEIIAETPMPKAADQLFDDFFFNFIANKKLQRKRIKFPLPIEKNGRITSITKKQWKTDYFFRPQGYYTLIFDNDTQSKYAKSTDLDTVIVEKIYLSQGIVKQY